MTLGCCARFASFRIPVRPQRLIKGDQDTIQTAAEIGKDRPDLRGGGCRTNPAGIGSGGTHSFTPASASPLSHAREGGWRSCRSDAWRQWCQTGESRARYARGGGMPPTSGSIAKAGQSIPPAVRPTPRPLPGVKPVWTPDPLRKVKRVEEKEGISFGEVGPDGPAPPTSCEDRALTRPRGGGCRTNPAGLARKSAPVILAC
jgi:hypothetical protein